MRRGTWAASDNIATLIHEAWPERREGRGCDTDDYVDVGRYRLIRSALFVVAPEDVASRLQSGNRASSLLADASGCPGLDVDFVTGGESVVFSRHILYALALDDAQAPLAVRAEDRKEIVDSEEYDSFHVRLTRRQ